MDSEKRVRCMEEYRNLLPNMADYVARYAGEKPKTVAIIDYDTGEKITWKQFDTAVSAFAAKLLSVGLRKGDVVATSLPLLKEHVYLMYACWRTGIIIAPLDLRLKSGEIQYCLNRMRPKAYFFLGKTPLVDFRPLIAEVMTSSPFVKYWVQFQIEKDLIMDGAVGIMEFTKDIKRVFLMNKLTGAVKKARNRVNKRDACLIIFTTGSTGSPKPALICHENILMQNISLAVAFEGDEHDRMLVNLPPSHAGCVTEQLATIIFGGGTAIILHIFDPVKSLDAVQKYGVTMLGQIPALYNMEWRLPDYETYDLSSLRFAIYGGQAVSREFLEKMQRMAPYIGTGLGLTETAGFCTYTEIGASVNDLAKGIGFDSPLCPISIREPMSPDGFAGREKDPGDVGEICFSGAQIFIGYMDDTENTAKTISKEGVCYTGDLGYYDDEGLHFAGRSKLVIKPKGYQVFPDDVETHIAGKLKGRVTTVACVGVEHEVFSEAIMIFVDPVDAETLPTPDDVMAACSDIAAYSRPSHVVILKPGEMPLNRVAKTDYMVLKERAREIVSELRAAGQWDS